MFEDDEARRRALARGLDHALDAYAESFDFDRGSAELAMLAALGFAATLDMPEFAVRLMAESALDAVRATRAEGAVLFIRGACA